MKPIQFNYIERFPEDIIDSAIGKPRKFRYTDLSSRINPIPSNSIIYKTITGLGATYSEVVADRNSIVMLPHVSIIKSKYADHTEKGHNVFAVHGEVKRAQVLEYIKATEGNKKLLTTPDGLDKIMWALEQVGNPEYKDYFLLIDECHKQINDASYREDMVRRMEDFFSFELKAMVSATPIEPTDPRFKEQGFEYLKAEPDYDYRKQLHLVHSNSVTDSFDNIINEHNHDKYFIFFNSINGIQSIVDSLCLDSETALFCSKENAFTYKDKFTNTYSEFELDNTVRYNFFTSSFYHGLDIILEQDPLVIIITDYGFARHSLVDPQTDVIQILGRVRKGYHKAYHINNTTRIVNSISQETAVNHVEISEKAYSMAQDLKFSSTANKDHVAWMTEFQQRAKPYADLLTTASELSYYKLDCYYSENRVKRYYCSRGRLKQAYIDSKAFIITETCPPFEPSKLIKLSGSHTKYSKSNIKEFCEELEGMSVIEGTEEYLGYLEVLRLYLPVVYEAYFRLGLKKLSECDHRIRRVKLELLKLDVHEKTNSNALIEAAYLTFRLGVKYPISRIKKLLQGLYHDFDIPQKVTATAIEHYFFCEFYNQAVKGITHRWCVLTDHKFSELAKYRRN